MKGKWIFRIISIMCALLGLAGLAFTVQMELGALILTPLGFLFGIGEMSNYETLEKSLTNLWWHVVPGLTGGAMYLVFMALSGLLFWGSVAIWRRGK